VKANGGSNGNFTEKSRDPFDGVSAVMTFGAGRPDVKSKSGPRQIILGPLVPGNKFRNPGKILKVF